MRIPITIKVPVRVAGQPKGPSLANIVIRDLSEGLEKISVRLLHRQLPNNKLARKKPAVGGEIHRSSPTRFPVVFQAPADAPPAPIIITPRLRYTVKTIHITLTWPTLPAAAELWHKFTRLSKRAWLRISIVVAVVIIALVGVSLFGRSNDTGQLEKSSAATGPPKLTHGTPDYKTVLPTGKTISQLGGWTRISPAGKDPVYTYVDKIGKVQINVSEQPLPSQFKADTANKVSQLAANFNATDKFTAANNITVYVASADDGEQSVIFTKSGLLVLIKSASQVGNNQWVNYVSSLR